MSKGNNPELAVESTSEARVATFIRKIYSILEEQLFPEIVDWNSEGTAIVIKKPTEFGQKVLPKYFKHNHISSFIRQLNMYSFQKKRSRHAGHIYCHELFQRGQKHLLSQIKRKVKDNFSVNSQTPSQDNTSQSVDFSALADENKMLKDLQKQVYSKVQSLEQKLKELVMQNQALQNQLHQQKQKEHAIAFNFQKSKQDGSMNQIPYLSHERPLPQQVYNPNRTQMTPINPTYSHNPHGHPYSHPHPFCSNNVFPRTEGEGMFYGDNMAKPRYEMGGNYGMSSQNPFSYNGFVNKSLEAVSPSTKPSPKSSKDTCPSPDLNRAPTLSFIDYNHEPSLLKKRELDMSYDKKTDDCHGVEEIKKFVRTTPFEGGSLNVGDIKKYQSNFFSSWGDKDCFEQKCDGELDLLCFE